jgi:hypothetical protein
MVVSLRDTKVDAKNAPTAKQNVIMLAVLRGNGLLGWFTRWPLSIVSRPLSTLKPSHPESTFAY